MTTSENPPDVAALAQRLIDLEQRVEGLEARLNRLAKADADRKRLVSEVARLKAEVEDAEEY